jgi:Na+-transporting methylmalonyl-CoA/oxaloacetate decarboxylase gamma subunit
MTPQLLAFTLPTNGLQLTALLAICFTVLIGLILVIFALGNVIKKLTLQKGDTKLTVGAVDEPEKLEEIESIDQAGQTCTPFLTYSVLYLPPQKCTDR